MRLYGGDIVSPLYTTETTRRCLHPFLLYAPKSRGREGGREEPKLFPLEHWYHLYSQQTQLWQRERSQENRHCSFICHLVNYSQIRILGKIPVKWFASPQLFWQTCHLVLSFFLIFSLILRHAVWCFFGPHGKWKQTPEFFGIKSLWICIQ